MLRGFFKQFSWRQFKIFAEHKGKYNKCLDLFEFKNNIFTPTGEILKRLYINIIKSLYLAVKEDFFKNLVIRYNTEIVQ